MKRYRLKEIAKTANVSISTVSRVLSDSHLVSDATREAVYAAIGKLNAERDMGDKVAVRKTILVMTSNFAHPVHSEMLETITRTAYENGYTVSVCPTDNRLLTFDELYTLVTDTNAAGLILLTCIARLCELEKLSRLLPIVYAGEIPQGSALSSITFNYYDIFRKTTLQCIASGRKRPALLQLKRYMFTELPAVAGFLDALKEAGMPCDSFQLIMPESFDYHLIFSELNRYFRRRPDIDALLCENDILAIAAYSAAAKNGYRVPEDLQIIASNGTCLSVISHPQISAITLPMDKLGASLCKLVMRQIEKNSREPERIYLQEN